MEASSICRGYQEQTSLAFSGAEGELVSRAERRGESPEHAEQDSGKASRHCSKPSELKEA